MRRSIPPKPESSQASRPPMAVKKPDPETQQLQFDNPAGIEWLDVPLGNFLYGEPPKPSNISQPFQIGKYPVTQAQYQKFIDANPQTPSPLRMQVG